MIKDENQISAMAPGAACDLPAWAMSEHEWPDDATVRSFGPRCGCRGELGAPIVIGRHQALTSSRTTTEQCPALELLARCRYGLSATPW
jgi:hypothetical protein